MSYDNHTPYDEMEEADKDRKVDGNWDTMISNPEYREAFNEAEQEGLGQEDAHVIAHLEAYDEMVARDKFGDEHVDELIDLGHYEPAHQRESGDQSSSPQEGNDEQEDKSNKSAPESRSLSDLTGE